MNHNNILAVRVNNQQLQLATFAFAAILFTTTLARFCGDEGGGNGPPPPPPRDAAVTDSGPIADVGSDAGSHDARVNDAGTLDGHIGDGGPAPGCGEPFGIVCLLAPQHGANVASPVHIIAGANNFVIEAADGIDTSNERGHFHILIDRDCLAAGTKMIADVNHVDLADGEHEVLLALSNGAHRLCLQAASGDHTSLPMTDEIEILVTD